MASITVRNASITKLSIRYSFAVSLKAIEPLLPIMSSEKPRTMKKAYRDHSNIVISRNGRTLYSLVPILIFMVLCWILMDARTARRPRTYKPLISSALRELSVNAYLSIIVRSVILTFDLWRAML